MDIVTLLIQAFAAFHVGIGILFGIFLLVDKIWKEDGAGYMILLFGAVPHIVIGVGFILGFIVVKLLW